MSTASREAVALVLLTGGVLVLTMPYAKSRRTVHAYEQARPCSATMRPGCLRNVEAVVTHIWIDKSGRGGHYEVTLAGPAPRPADAR